MDERCKTTKKSDIFLRIVVGIGLLLGLIFGTCARTVRVDGDSMNPTYYDGDLVLVLEYAFRLDFGDIVVADTEDEEGLIIKRVVGLPGDVVEIDYDSHMLIRNGRILNERSYILEPISRPCYEMDDSKTYVVPAGEYFLLGDNRNDSLDSRYVEIGTVSADNILGKVIFPAKK